MSDVEAYYDNHSFIRLFENPIFHDPSKHSDIMYHFLQEVAHEKTQKYKEGKFILERSKLIDADGSDMIMGGNGAASDGDEHDA